MRTEKGQPQEVPTDVYLSFVSSLFDNRFTLFTGMVVHILTFLTVYVQTGASFYLLLCGGFVIVFSFRLHSFFLFDREDKAQLTRSQIAAWERRYVLGGASTMAILGIGSGYAMLAFEDTFAELACIAVAMATMVSIVGRNYGSRLAVDLQTVACCAPMVIGSLLAQDVFKSLLSLLLIPFWLTTRAMANGVRDFLYENVIASREMAKIANRFDTALSNMTHGLLMLDPNNRIEVVNRKACELLHLGDRSRLTGCDLDVVLRYGVRYTFIDGSMPSLLQKQLMQLTQGLSTRAVMHFSDDLVLEFSAKRRDEGGVVLIFEDVTARVAADRRILHMARYDNLTGLPNRAYFTELVVEQLAQLDESGATVGLMILDVADFKHVNDLKGHLTGDRLLVAISARLTKLAGDKAIVGRFVGDHFLLFFRGVKGRAELAAEMRDLHAQACGSYNVDGVQIPVTFSAGAVLFDDTDLNVEEWPVKLDIALFESKARSRGQFALFAREMDARYLERQRLKADLRAAVDAQQITVVYQPMLTPDGRKLVCCEALARWHHADKGAIPPNIFIQIAEDMGIVRDITLQVLRKACSECRDWPEMVGVSVNLSGQDLRHGDLASTVETILQETGLPANRLHLEVTEGSLIEELSAARVLLERLRALGVTISIDDFGTGFSSLSYLDTLPVDVVKIDRSFVRDIGENPRRLKLLRGIVSLTRGLGIGIVIEGVETREQLTLIDKYHCADAIQGYVFSPPIAPHAVKALAEEAANSGIVARTGSV
ncbi:EAL domain-containing protein [Rhizobium sp. AQ_MP]|uniref:putative bifunctional diguanylate cyclase/phosphodiesterase n=1 Tax=Rhizobium sp. AQ_MP TaxID=2761536 RepID=UPI00163A6FFA|nr:EAL domain-containing protein [Rhizobium sp. AQ_MP]MBC2772215.1 EAL domain-containing protein [Rhizobium sp. AQ_MP]